MGTDDLCALRSSRLGWHLVSEERRRLANVDVGRAIYLGLPYYSRWLWSVGRVLIEKQYISWGELTDRLAEVQERYAGGLNGQYPEAKPKFEGDPSKVKRNKHIGEAMGKGRSGLLLRAGRRSEVQGRRPGQSQGTARNVLHPHAGVLPRRGRDHRRGHLRNPAPEDETWDREDAKSEWMYIVRFNQSELWDNYTGPANDTLQTEIPERWLEDV